MMRQRLLTLMGWCLAALCARESLAQDPDTTLLFNVATGDWNVATSWEAAPPSSGPFIPGDGFPDEVASISNGGICNLAVPAQFPITGLVLGQSGFGTGVGTLNVSGTGSLIATGAVRIGNDGQGTLNMSAGSMTVGELRVGGSAASALNLSGNASVSASSANLLRNTRISGPNVGFEVAGDVAIGGNFTANMTAANHSVIDATGAAVSVGGVLHVGYNGANVNYGKAWTLVDGSTVSGAFTSVEQLPSTGLPRGGALDVRYDAGGNGNVEVTVGNRLVLSVDRASGETTISNPIGVAIAINGYDITSANGLLSPADWDSFNGSGVSGPGWALANPDAEHLSELNLLNSNSITVGGSRPLGEAYIAGAIRRQDEDLAFQYSTPDGKVWDGIVEYLGAVNDLVLRVDPATGEAAIQNFSPNVEFDIKGYDITSASGSLSVAGWTSFQETGDAGPNWFEANPSASNLSELNLLSSTSFTGGVQILLGDVLANLSSRDLVFKFATSDGEVLEGTVEYGAIEQSGQPGDTDNDGDVDLDDLNAVRNNFGAGASQSVPEPSAAVLGLIALAVVGGWQRRRVLSNCR